jgi:hypothetical protein
MAQEGHRFVSMNRVFIGGMASVDMIFGVGLGTLNEFFWSSLLQSGPLINQLGAFWHVLERFCIV